MGSGPEGQAGTREQIPGLVRRMMKPMWELCVRSHAAALIGVLLLSFCTASRAQKPIRVDVNLVNVAFTVRDASGGLVADLI